MRLRGNDGLKAPSTARFKRNRPQAQITHAQAAIAFDSGLPARINLSRRSRRLRNTTDHLAETAIDVGDLGCDAAGQVAEQKRSDVADFFGRDVTADR